MKNINLLIIDDDKSVVNTYREVIDGFNKKNNVKINITEKEDYNGGVEELIRPEYDGVVIDLKLSGSEEYEGVQIIEQTYKRCRLPIFVYSGNISQIDDYDENFLFKKFSRTTPFETLLEAVIKVFNTGITGLLKTGGTIDLKLTEIFWNHLASDLDIWIDQKNNSLLRYIFLHFQEHLEFDEAGFFDDYHQKEIYISPPIKKDLHTGDLVKHNGDFYVVMTPACDMSLRDNGNRSVEKITLVKALDFNPSTYCKNATGKIEKGKITEFVKNKKFRYHYLPPYKGNKGLLIDFQDILTIRVDDISSISREASISNTFIKDIISRFSAYFARQGQPTFNQDQLIEEFGKPITPPTF